MSQALTACKAKIQFLSRKALIHRWQILQISSGKNNYTTCYCYCSNFTRCPLYPSYWREDRNPFPTFRQSSYSWILQRFQSTAHCNCDHLPRPPSPWFLVPGISVRSSNRYTLAQLGTCGMDTIRGRLSGLLQ